MYLGGLQFDAALGADLQHQACTATQYRIDTGVESSSKADIQASFDVVRQCHDNFLLLIRFLPDPADLAEYGCSILR